MDILNTKIVKIRKPRSCFGCCKKFDIKSQMERTTYADQGDIYSIYECNICSRVIKQLDYVEEGYTRGWFLDELESRNFKEQIQLYNMASL